MYTHTLREQLDPGVGERFTVHSHPNSEVQESFEMVYLSPSYTRLRERLISDSVTPRSNWKKCEHYKVSSVDGSGSSTVPLSVVRNDVVWYDVGALTGRASLYKYEYGTAGLFNSELPAFEVDRADGGFVPPPAGLDSLIQGGLAAMLPKIKAELSLINSLIELKDILTFRSTIEGIKNTITVLLKNKPSGATLKSLFRTKADVYLQYKFNIAPLLSDISGIYRSLANTERRINAFISRSGSVRVSHYTKHLTESADPLENEILTQSFTASGYPATGSYVIACRLRTQRSVVTEPATFHAQVQYNYNYTAYQVEHARILALLDAFGVNLNPAVIWNAIPWSFVVDWIFGVSRYLDTLKVGAMDPKINILRCLWSIKRSRRIQVSGLLFRDEGFYPSKVYPPVTIARPVVVETAYRREPFMPSGSSIVSSGLSSTEFTLGAALVVSQRRRPKRLRR